MTIFSIAVLIVIALFLYFLYHIISYDEIAQLNKNAEDMINQEKKENEENKIFIKKIYSKCEQGDFKEAEKIIDTYISEKSKDLYKNKNYIGSAISLIHSKKGLNKPSKAFQELKKVTDNFENHYLSEIIQEVVNDKNNPDKKWKKELIELLVDKDTNREDGYSPFRINYGPIPSFIGKKPSAENKEWLMGLVDRKLNIVPILDIQEIEYLSSVYGQSDKWLEAIELNPENISIELIDNYSESQDKTKVLKMCEIYMRHILKHKKKEGVSDFFDCLSVMSELKNKSKAKKYLEEFFSVFKIGAGQNINPHRFETAQSLWIWKDYVKWLLENSNDFESISFASSVEEMTSYSILLKLMKKSISLAETNHDFEEIILNLKHLEERCKDQAKFSELKKKSQKDLLTVLEKNTLSDVPVLENYLHTQCGFNSKYTGDLLGALEKSDPETEYINFIIEGVALGHTRLWVKWKDIEDQFDESPSSLYNGYIDTRSDIALYFKIDLIKDMDSLVEFIKSNGKILFEDNPYGLKDNYLDYETTGDGRYDYEYYLGNGDLYNGDGDIEDDASINYGDELIKITDTESLEMYFEINESRYDFSFSQKEDILNILDSISDKF